MLRTKILFISEALSAPFDEGIKNVAFSIYDQLKKVSDVLTVTNIENEMDQDDVRKIKLNKLFLNYKLRKSISDYSPSVILYFPESSVTIASFLRAKILNIIGSPSKVAVLGVQHREYSRFQRFILKNLLKPDLLLLLGRSDEEFFMETGVNVKVLPPAVDVNKFIPPAIGEKDAIREKFSIPCDKYVVLHVGHIKVDRNIECLMEVQKIENVQVIIVGSTSLGMEKELKEKLVKSGIMVIDKYIPDIGAIYKMSDLYVFPVRSESEAIEMPLSVLEAMACNLPVITTRFQGLTEHFKEDECFRYVDDDRELAVMVGNMYRVKVTNSNKIRYFTWRAFSGEILSAFDKL